MNTYLLCNFIRSLENTVRLALGEKKHNLPPMPDFEEMFTPRKKKTVDDMFQDFFAQVDAMEEEPT